MRILGVIPARGGSKGVPRKNIRKLGDRPLLGHTAAAALASRLARTVLSTDDEEIAAVGRTLGLDVPFLRPPDLATDSARAIPVIQHALTALAGDSFDAVMMLQPTTPFRRSTDIDGAIALLESSGADSVISVVDTGGHHPARMKFLDGDRLVDPPYCEAYENQPRQELPAVYLRNGAVYLARTAIVMAGSFKGKDCRAWIMPAARSVNIDNELEFRQAEWLLAEGLVGVKILCVEPLRYDDEARRALAALGDVAWVDCADQAEFMRILSEQPWQVLVTRLGLAVDAAALAAAPELRVVATPTTGVDHIDTDALAARGARLLSLRGETAFLESIRATAEHTWALLLALCRRLPAATADVGAGHWRREPFLGTELHGKSLGVIGVGRLGRMVCGYGVAFGMHVLGHDRDPAAFARAPRGTLSAPLEIALAADIVSLHLPLEAATRGWLSAARIAQMAPGALLINTARGELIDETALLEALTDGRLGGAALDVLTGDSAWDGRVSGGPTHSLVMHATSHDNLLLTPHIGGYGRESIARTRRFLIDKLKHSLETP